MTEGLAVFAWSVGRKKVVKKQQTQWSDTYRNWHTCLPTYVGITKRYVGRSNEVHINTTQMPRSLFKFLVDKIFQKTRYFFSLYEALIWFGLALFQGYLLRGKKEVFRDPPIQEEKLSPNSLVWHTKCGTSVIWPQLLCLTPQPPLPLALYYNHSQSCELIHSVTSRILPRLSLLPKCLLPPLPNHTWLDSLSLGCLLQEAFLEHSPSPNGSGSPHLLQLWN